METPYDWITVAMFAGLVVLFMQRSTAVAPRDSLWQYLVAAVGCAVANYFGNHAVEDKSILYHAIAVALILATAVFVFVVLKPLDRA
ncbi:XrtV sorting system accessory protein [Sphingomonas montanisoli]|uniref:Uncharacterized protein n=1 Tax=Sphingomonas montanisoli TaxID=2606412 RepID=A0A5D9CD39_9SPHN|nr:XrtV sorting system accessory protein [Sphingomonas montanisoli]TZG28025.1 hypothetical protein FYJ91_10865 [Sphingomonas montanisoli]